MRVRLADVAALAQVSERTVANVVSGNPHVRPELRARVQSAIDELGYVPNATARRLATGSTGTLAVALPDVDVPYYAEIASLLTREAARRGYSVLMELTGGREEDELAVVSPSIAGLVDGILFHPFALTPQQIGEAQRRVPLVVLGEAEAPPAVDHVMIDNTAAVAQVTRHLLDSGCRRIALLGRTVRAAGSTEKARVVGHLDTLAEAGVAADPALQPVLNRWDEDSGAAAVDALIGAGTAFDAVLCCDDRLAVGAVSALTRHGRGIPLDVRVTGWDDLRVSRFTVPPLTTIAPDKQRIAELALDLVLRRIADPDAEGRQETAPHALEVRASAP